VELVAQPKASGAGTNNRGRVDEQLFIEGAGVVSVRGIGKGVFTFGVHRTPKTEGHVEKLMCKSWFVRMNDEKNTSLCPPKVKTKYKYKYNIYIFIDVCWCSGPV
jgi:hypothetical protein